jgi:ankyrin repeat protein
VYSTEGLESYFAYRIAHEPTNGNPLLNCIGRVANNIFKMRDVNDPALVTVEACLDTLCSRSSLWRTTTSQFKKIFCWKSTISDDEYEGYLIAAALCTNTLSIVQDIATNVEQVVKWYNFLNNNLIFGCFDSIAAKYSSQEILRYLLTIGVPGLRNRLFLDAAKASRADIVRFLYNFKKEEVPWDYEVLCAAQCTASLEVLTFVRELLPLYPNPKLCSWDLQMNLMFSASQGSLEMTTHLIQLGVHAGRGPYRGVSPFLQPVYVASRRGHMAVVELLLKHGADPKLALVAAAQRGHTEIVRELLNTGLKPVHVLSKAIPGGYLEVVRLLLDAGADANESGTTISPLAGAIANENTAIFKLLIERGANVQSIAQECIKIASEDGLESMIQLLKEHGVNIVE